MKVNSQGDFYSIICYALAFWLFEAVCEWTWTFGIIITSYVPLEEWYRKCTDDDDMDKNYNGSSARQQLDRRINTVIKVDKSEIKVYYHDSYGYDKLLYRLSNATYLLKKQENAPKRIERDILLRAADHLAEKLEVTEEYEKFKDVDFLNVYEKKSTYEEDCYSILEDIMKENV